MRRIIGILFVLMLAASVGATGGYGGLYVNNRAKNPYYVMNPAKSTPHQPIYVETFSTLPTGVTASNNAAHSDETTICRAGSSSRKIESTGTNGYLYVRYSVSSPFDVRGCDMRLRYYVHRTLAANNIHHLEFVLYSTWSSNGGALRLPMNTGDGWHDIEFSAGTLRPKYGTFDPTDPIDMIRFDFGAGAQGLPSGDYVVLDLFEVRPTYADKGYVCIWLDDGYKDQFDTMIPYAQRYGGIPIWVGITPEYMGTYYTAGSYGNLYYGSWAQVYDVLYGGDVFIGTHSQASSAKNLSGRSLALWIEGRKKPLYERGLFNAGLDIFALPGGQVASLGSAEDLKTYYNYFSVVRGTRPFYHEDNGGWNGDTDAGYRYQNGFVALHPLGYYWSSAIQVDANWQTYVDYAIKTKSLVHFYAHGLNETNSYFLTTTAQWQAFIDYLHNKQQAGELKVISVADWVNGNIPKEGGSETLTANGAAHTFGTSVLQNGITVSLGDGLKECQVKTFRASGTGESVIIVSHHSTGDAVDFFLDPGEAMQLAWSGSKWYTCWTTGSSISD